MKMARSSKAFLLHDKALLTIEGFAGLLAHVVGAYARGRANRQDGKAAQNRFHRHPSPAVSTGIITGCSCDSVKCAP